MRLFFNKGTSDSFLERSYWNGRRMERSLVDLRTGCWTGLHTRVELLLLPLSATRAFWGLVASSFSASERCLGGRPHRHKSSEMVRP